MATKIKLQDKVKVKGGKTTGVVVQRRFASKGTTFDFGVDFSKAGMPFIAGFNADELEKVAG